MVSKMSVNSSCILFRSTMARSQISHLMFGLPSTTQVISLDPALLIFTLVMVFTILHILVISNTQGVVCSNPRQIDSPALKPSSWNPRMARPVTLCPLGRIPNANLSTTLTARSNEVAKFLSLFLRWAVLKSFS